MSRKRQPIVKERNMKLVKELWPNGMGWDLLDGDV